ncbi:MAG: MipA/OmpV family protein [Pseudomonadota bacterium]
MQFHSSVLCHVILTCVVLAASAWLQDATADDGKYSDANANDGVHLRVGGALTFRPKYEGSDEHDVYGIPLIIPDFGSSYRLPGVADRFEFRGIDDVRFKLLNRYYGFEAGPLAGYAFGRDEDDGDLLDGLGDVDDGFIVGGFIGYRWYGLLFDVSYHRQVTGDVDGGQLRFGLSSKVPVSDRVILTGRVGATYADDDYMAAYFGVSESQSNNSGANLSEFDAEAGFKDIHLETGATIDLGYNWQLLTKLRYSRLIGDAADSPVVETEDQFSGTVGLTYRFRVR